MAALAVGGSVAYAIPTCSIASGAMIAFGPIVALESTGSVTANSGATFWVNCTSDVSSSPTLYSSTPRTLQSGGNSLPFSLSAVAAGSIELPTLPGGQSITMVRNGTPQTVTLYGRVAAADFKGLPSGSYARSITLTLEY